MDRSLDEIIAERPKSSDRAQGRPGRPRRNNWPRDGIKKSFREDRADLDLDWVHDKYDDDRDTRTSYHGSRASRLERQSPEPDQVFTGAKLRVTNLHYDLTENDLEDLFTRIGPIHSLSLRYDRAGRSEGVAFVTYKRYADAQTAIREFDGANAKGQPIHLTLLPSPTSAGKIAPRNPFDYAEKPKGSLFDRSERPRDRNPRSLSPESQSDSHDSVSGSRRRPRGGRTRRSDVSKPPPDHIDRYVPGQSPRRRHDSGRSRGRRPGEIRDSKDRNSSATGMGRRMVNGRPRKTQEELDQEMEDYWVASNVEAGNTGDANGGISAPAPIAAAGDDDIDMIE